MSVVKISIITPTFNRQHELAHLIESIQHQTLDHGLFELIISDDGSNDNTEEYVRKQAKEVDFDLRFIKQANQGPGAARNHGLQEARGDLILFIDSDCEAHPSWVETIFGAFKQEKFDACGGPDGAKDDFTPLQKAIDFSMTSFFTTGGMRGHSEKMLAKFYPRTHNMGMTAKLYQKVGGFGSLRHGQDIEMSHRIHSSGAVIQFLPDAIVYHRRRTSLKKFFRQVFNWGVARINLGKINSKMLEPIHFIPALVVSSILLVFILTVLKPAVFAPLVLAGILGLIALSIWAGIKNRNLRVIGYSLAAIPIQIIGYGTGFLIAFIKRYIFGQGLWTGFTKKYYE